MILDKERETASRCVIVLEHPIDWSDAAMLVCNVTGRVESTGDRLDRGCWFFLPGFTVFAADPSQEFFACVEPMRPPVAQAKSSSVTFHKELGRILREAEKLHRSIRMRYGPGPRSAYVPVIRGHILRGGLFIDGHQVLAQRPAGRRSCGSTTMMS